MNTIANRQVICNVLLKQAATDKNLLVLCSDSRGSASLTAFAEQYPEQFIEVGIAEQSLVSVSAGLARCGKRVFAASPASFLSTRSFEQIKVDVAYSNANVKLIGISGGISYGALGMTHHSAQDIAAIAAIPSMRVFLPSDRHQTKALIEMLLHDDEPAYIRVGRNAVEDIYNDEYAIKDIKATIIRDGFDVAIISCGEMVKPSLDAAKLLEKNGISACVIDMYCVKPLDRETVLNAAKKVKCIITVEEHSPYGGLGSMVAQLTAEYNPLPVKCLSLPDEPVIAGASQEIFDHYSLNANGIATSAETLLRRATL